MGENTSTRRELFHKTAAGAGLMASLSVPAAFAQTKMTPDAALAELMAGNKRYLAGRMTSLKANFAQQRRETAEKQEPFAAVLSCSDSRVPVELVFDQSIGRIFVTRLAGNITTPETIASLEYGAAVLGTKTILVLGHENCGAVKATIANKPVPGQISALYPHIRPAVDKAGPNLDAAIRANAKIQAGLLRDASPVLAELVKKGEIKITAGYYSVVSGAVTLLA